MTRSRPTGYPSSLMMSSYRGCCTGSTLMRPRCAACLVLQSRQGAQHEVWPCVPQMGGKSALTQSMASIS
eukprot:4383456-Amphidinium_carterae.1